MKIKSKGSNKTEFILMVALMFAKAMFALPIYEDIAAKIAGRSSIETLLMTFAIAAGILIFSVLYSMLLMKLAGDIGEGGQVLLVLAVAEPLLIVNMQSVFQLLAAILTVIWIAVAVKDKTRIIAAVVSVAASAIIAFIMPCGAFSFVLLGIIVLAATASGSVIAKIISYAGAVISAAAAYFTAKLSSGDLRFEPEFIKIFNRFGGTESHALSLDRIELGYSASMLFQYLVQALIASLPLVAIMIYIIVKTLTYKADYAQKNEKHGIFEKIKTVAAIVVPYAFMAFASVICNGKGGISALNFVPLMTVAVLGATGNRYVKKALDDAAAFAKAYPVVAFIVIVWLASFMFAISTPNTVFRSASTFAA